MPILKDLIKDLDCINIYGSKDAYVSGISDHSQRIAKDYIFIAVDGTNLDGHSFINEAINRKARCIVTSKDFKCHDGITKIIVKDTRIAVAKLANKFYENPSEKIKVIGITGTNGKTTTTYLIESLLRSCGYKCGVIGTINYRFINTIIPAKNTTPGPLELASFLNKMVHSGLDYCIMEVSSHAIDQRRIDGINFDVAIFTNLTCEHLDYHKNMSKYFYAKSRLFSRLSFRKDAILNMDDEYYDKLKDLTKAKILTYAVLHKKADIQLLSNKFLGKFQRLDIYTPKGTLEIETRLIGRHNIYNILCAVAFGYCKGIKLRDIKKGIEDLQLVPGRLQEIDTGQNFRVFVDYAHTDDGLKQVLLSLREIPHERLIVVFGCGGDRCKTKRPKMGKVASQLSDYVIVTNDNPRSEDPKVITDAIIQGFNKGFRGYKVLLDRAKAIKEALAIVKKNDVVLIAGKGHETYQIFKNKTIDFDDVQVVRDLL